MTHHQDLDDLRAMVRRFLRDRSPVTAVRTLMTGERGYDPALWSELVELGLVGVAVPERYSGGGRGLAEACVVAEEAGQVLLCAPYLATAGLAIPALLACGTETDRRDLLPGLATGGRIGTLAFVEEDGAWDLSTVRTSARPDGAGWLLDGAKSFVLDGHVADLLLVVAVAPGGEPSLFAVDGAADGLNRRALSTLDPTRKLARLEFTATPARLVGELGRAQAGLSASLDVARILLAAEQTGGAQRCLDMSVEHARTRVQFGRLIGSFQAVKHRCADMLVAIEAARSALWWAARADDAERPAAAAVAKLHAADAFFLAAAGTVQLHGGIGFTWEHDAHLYYKRAKSGQLMLGDAGHHQQLLADRIGV